MSIYPSETFSSSQVFRDILRPCDYFVRISGGKSMRSITTNTYDTDIGYVLEGFNFAFLIERTDEN